MLAILCTYLCCHLTMFTKRRWSLYLCLLRRGSHLRMHLHRFVLMYMQRPTMISSSEMLYVAPLIACRFKYHIYIYMYRRPLYSMQHSTIGPRNDIKGHHSSTDPHINTLSLKGLPCLTSWQETILLVTLTRFEEPSRQSHRAPLLSLHKPLRAELV